MQEAIVKLLKYFMDALASEKHTNDEPEEIINDFLQKAELALRDNYKEELVNHLKKYLL